MKTIQSNLISVSYSSKVPCVILMPYFLEATFLASDDGSMPYTSHPISWHSFKREPLPQPTSRILPGDVKKDDNYLTFLLSSVSLRSFCDLTTRFLKY